MFQLPLKISLDSSATLKSFFVGSNTELIEKLRAYTEDSSFLVETKEVDEVDTKLSDSSFISLDTTNMLFIWGNHSSGKTHLAQAICRIFDHSTNKTCVYLPLNNEQISHHILDGLADIDLVCIDSLEYVRGNDEWQVALFNLYNELKDSDKKLVIFSRETPLQMQLELADLTSRLSSMSIYKLNEIDDEHLVEFIQTIGKNAGVEINIEVANFILNRSDRSIINLKTIITKLDEQSLAHHRKVTIPFVKEILKI
ncbi:MAG: DnaA regulatory inactivator Hda [Kangiella sp.]|nr:MAG: DnaA regulatory inactivator Hda [Kangiella sp.]